MRALLVEDNPADARLIREALRESQAAELTLVVVERLADALLAVAAAPPDVALLDLTLPDASGVEAVRRMHAAAPALPIVVLTGIDDDAIALQAMKEGAQDYLVKGRADGNLLSRSIRYAIERKRAEEDARRLLLEHTARVEAEKIARAREEMLSVVSHDLRNPLTVISFASRALRRQELDLSGRVRNLDKLDRAVSAMTRLIGDLLDVTRIDSGQLVINPAELEPAELLGAASEAHLTIAEEKSIVVESRVETGCALVRADRERVLQVFSNLLGNAIKFTPEGGAIFLRADPGAGLVRFSVLDTGPGIRADDRERVFDRFWRTSRENAQGTGLGLAIAKGIVEAHGGSIWVEPAPSGGAAFVFTLPASARLS